MRLVVVSSPPTIDTMMLAITSSSSSRSPSTVAVASAWTSPSVGEDACLRTAGRKYAVISSPGYFRSAVRKQASSPTEGLVHALATATVDGDRLDEEEVIANIIVTMVGGLETTTNLIGNGILTLLRQPAALEQLRSSPELVPSAVE